MATIHFFLVACGGDRHLDHRRNRYSVQPLALVCAFLVVARSGSKGCNEAVRSC